MNFLATMPVHMFVRDGRQGNPATAAEIVREVEAMGYWGVTCSHHISDPGLSAFGHAGGEEVNWRYTDPIAILSYMAAISKKLMLVASVIVVPYRQPVELAHGLATIDALSGGRLIFGAGAGSQQSEFDLVGAPRNQRGRITDEWLDIIVELWTNPKASFSGRYHSFKDVNLAVRPVRQPRPPIWIGGGTRAAVERAIRIGDAWAPTGYGFPSADSGPRGTVTAQVFREELAWANEQRKALGKPPLEGTVGNGVPIQFKDKPRPAPYSRRDVGYFTCVGTPTEIFEEYAAFKEAGATNFTVKLTGDTPSEYLAAAETFAAKVMPGLR